MIELQPRGTDAAGVAVINEGPAESRVFKKPLRPDRIVVRPMFDEMMELIGPQTNFVMLHARAATAGSTEENFNNHPIVTEPIIGIHNGTLYNDHHLFDQFAQNFDQEGSVDSEIIFKLYLHFVSTGLNPKRAMAQTGSMLFGAFTGGLVDMRKPSEMIMFKFERSLCVFKLPYYDTIIAVSEAQFYDRVAKRLGVRTKETCEMVYDGTGLFFDLDIEKPITDEITDFDIPTQKGDVRQYSAWLAGAAV